MTLHCHPSLPYKQARSTTFHPSSLILSSLPMSPLKITAAVAVVVIAIVVVTVILHHCPTNILTHSHLTYLISSNLILSCLLALSWLHFPNFISPFLPLSCCIHCLLLACRTLSTCLAIPCHALPLPRSALPCLAMPCFIFSCLFKSNGETTILH